MKRRQLMIAASATMCLPVLAQTKKWSQYAVLGGD